jgi:hypothetical protein
VSRVTWGNVKQKTEQFVASELNKLRPRVYCCL